MSYYLRISNLTILIHNIQIQNNNLSEQNDVPRGNRTHKPRHRRKQPGDCLNFCAFN